MVLKVRMKVCVYLVLGEGGHVGGMSGDVCYPPVPYLYDGRASEVWERHLTPHQHQQIIRPLSHLSLPRVTPPAGEVIEECRRFFLAKSLGYEMCS